MRSLVSAALQLRWLVAALALALMVLGGLQAAKAPLDVFPEFAPPLVEIQTEAPGLSSLEVEALVTVPLENALAGVLWLKTLRSKSVQGLSSVVLIFADGTDVMRARQMVGERVSLAAARLPRAARPPVMLQPLSATSRVLKVGMTSSTLSQMEMTDVVRWQIRPRLLAIPGVANVAIWGERDRQLQVRVDPEQLRAHNVRLEEVTRAAQAAVQVVGGGFLDTPNQRLPVFHVPAVVRAADLANVTVRGSLRLGDVARVTEDFSPPIGDAVINGKPGLLLIVEKQRDGNTLAVTRQVEETLVLLQPAMKGIEVVGSIFRPATFIERAIANLRDALVLGCLLVTGVLLLFLYDWRTALISVIAIPLSLISAALVIARFGGTLNTMVLAGLAIALGEVVDDALIDVENILRRLRLEREVAEPRAPLWIVLEASLEVRSAVVYATLIVLALFVPVFLLDGVPGAFFRPLGLAYAIAVFASMLVALLVTPALSLLLLPRAAQRERRPRFAAWLEERYRSLLQRFVDRWQAALITLAIVFASTIAVVPFLGEAFMPQFRETDFLMHWVAKPGASLEAVQRTAVRAAQELMRVPGVRGFGSHLGRAEVADEVVGANFAELWISVDPAADHDQALHAVQEIVDGYPGIYRDVQTYLQERIKEVLAASSGAIVVRLYGPDLAVLRERAEAIGSVVSAIPGVVNTKVEPQILVPQIGVRVRPDAAHRMGTVATDIGRAVSTLVQGQKVGEVYHADRIVDVVVWGEPKLHADPLAIGELRIDTLLGQVPLAELADVAIVPTPNVVQRESASRRIDVSCDARGRDLGAVVAELRGKLAAIALPRGYHLELLGEYDARAKARTRLTGATLLSLLVVLAILYVDFRSPRLVALLALSLPFALVGGVGATLLAGGVISLGSLVGLVTVLGIAARNGIMLVSHYRHLETEELMPFGRDLVVRGTQERLTPILMTALATALALLPLALGGGKPGQEIEHPMALVILGGLVTSTLLNLVLLPAIYLRFAKAPR